MGAPLTVAINAQIEPNGRFGGVEAVVVGLIAALGRLAGEERFRVVAHWRSGEWLRPYLGPNTELVRGPGRERSAPFRLARAAVQRSPRLLDLWRRHVEHPRRLRPPISDGFWEGLGCDVVHFPYQAHAVCGVPTIYNPHDLQHLHLPQFFAPRAILERDALYRVGCQMAATVVVGSEWVKQDVMAHYAIGADKIQVIPWAPPTASYAAPTAELLADVRRRHGLDAPFLYYPAMTWPHKNHLRLLDAFARALPAAPPGLQLVCTGFQNEHWPRIEERIAALGLSGRARFLGMLPKEEVRCVYRLARAVIVPTLFEAASAPVFEAWAEGAAVACSTVTSLPEQAGDAALLFDPTSEAAIADAILRLAGDAALRERLVAAGARRLADFDWARTAQAYRAVYRRAAQRPLTDADRALLARDWSRPAAAEGR